jgi:RNA polymerase sigma-70 factor (ECF subfamily)
VTLTAVTSTSAPRELEREGLPVGQESAAFASLVRCHGARVWRSLRYLGVREADVADASQEVFLVVHRRLSDFRGDSKFESWLYGICLGVARNQRRKQLRNAKELSQAPTEAYDATQDLELDQQRIRRELRWALDQITPEQREVFVLHEIEELRMSVVAATVGCPVFTAYSRLRLARKHLSRLLQRRLTGVP